MNSVNFVIPIDIQHYLIYTDKETVHIDTGLNPSDFFKLMEENKEKYNRSLKE